MTDHYALANKTLQAVLNYAETDENTSALVSIAAAQVHAALALAEQTRIANLIALAAPPNEVMNNRTGEEALKALTDFRKVGDVLAFTLRPEVARALRIEDTDG